MNEIITLLAAAFETMIDKRVEAKLAAMPVPAPALTNSSPHAEIDYEALARSLNYESLAEKIDYRALGSQIDYYEFADDIRYDNFELDYSEFLIDTSEIEIDYSNLADKVDYHWLYKLMSDRISKDDIEINYTQVAENLDYDSLISSIPEDTLSKHLKDALSMNEVADQATKKVLQKIVGSLMQHFNASEPTQGQV